jgi:coenzyme F420-reducing hydrogenase alpha subunit
VSLEGRVSISVRWDGRSVGSAIVASSRPAQPARALLGRSPAEAVATVPLLFAICGRSQAVASAQACEAALGRPAGPAVREARTLAVAVEILHEHAWRTLLDWPTAIGETPDPRVLVAARRALGEVFAALGAALSLLPQAPGVDARTSWERLRATLGTLLDDAGLPRGASRTDDAALSAFDAWVAARASAPARTLGAALDAAADFAPRAVPLLPPEPPQGLAIEVAGALDRDARFAAAPTADGTPRETGPLARHASHRLLRRLADAQPGPVGARLAARLVELDALVAAEAPWATLGAASLAEGDAVSWVETARGLLFHRVRLERGRVARYDIVAPTEWNFHPAGALATELPGLRATDEAALRRRVALLAQSLDPCVAFSVEVGRA